MTEEGSPKHAYEHVSSPRSTLRGLTDAEVQEYELRVTNLLVDHPKRIMCCLFTVFLALSFVSFGVIGFKLSDGPFEVRGDIRTKRQDAFTAFKDDFVDKQPTGKPVAPGETPEALMRSLPESGFHMVYDGNGKNVLTVEALKYIKKTEDVIFQHANYKLFCLLNWLSPNESTQCPGPACPGYRTGWDFTQGNLMPGGSRVICTEPHLSVSWVFWNHRVVMPGTMLECSAASSFDVCAAQGKIAHLSDVKGRTETEIRTLIEKGGVEPTQKEIELFARVAERLLSSAQGPGKWAYLNYFFDKGFGKNGVFTSGVMRSTLQFGGPTELLDPVGLDRLCHARGSQTDCVASDHCQWGSTAGFFRNATGCSSKVVMEDDDKEDGKRFSKRFALAITKDYDDLLGEGPLDVLYLADGTLFDKFQDVLLRDSLLAFLSFVFVYLYLQIHTGSFMLATLGMVQVIMPFPLAYFVYRTIFGIKNFYGLSVLTLFIVLAIGADDIFVFFDSWKHADQRPRHDTCVYMRGRFAHAWKESGKAMGITSLTTMCAFIATMSSSLATISYFGTFAAMLVFFDYALVMTFFACSVVVVHRTTEDAIGCCCFGGGAWCNCCTCFTGMLDAADPGQPGWMQSKLSHPRTFETLFEARNALGQHLDFTPLPANSKTVNPSEEALLLANDGQYKKRKIVSWVLFGLALAAYGGGFGALSSARKADPGPTMFMMSIIVLALALFCAACNASRAASDRIKELGLSLSGNSFFSDHFAPFLAGTKGPGQNRVVRLIPAVLLVGLWAFMCVKATELEPTTKTEQWMPTWHPIQRWFTAWSDDFRESDQAASVKVVVTVGINADDPADRSNADESASDPKKGTVPIFVPGDGTQYTTPEFQRFMKDFCTQTIALSKQGKYLQRTMFEGGVKDQNCIMLGFEDYVTKQGLTFPVPQAQFVAKMWEYTESQREMLHNGDGIRSDEVHYDKVLYNFPDPARDPTGIKAMYMEFNTTLKEHGNSNSAIEAWHDDWKTFMGDINDGKSVWVRNIYGTTPFPLKGQVMQVSELWVWMKTQQVLVSGAVTGTIVSLALAAIVVFLGTLNAWIAVLVLVELIGVVGYVLGTMSMLGWEMGTIESIAVTILVGLSVDYVVHLAMHYEHADVHADGQHQERQKRVFISASEMGPTVMGGAATSIGATLPLLLCWVQFLHKFGVCFLFTIVYSYMWSMFFFLPLMSIVGPQGGFASIQPLLARCLPSLFGDETKKGRPLESFIDQEMTGKPLPEAERPLVEYGAAVPVYHHNGHSHSHLSQQQQQQQQAQPAFSQPGVRSAAAPPAATHIATARYRQDPTASHGGSTISPISPPLSQRDLALSTLGTYHQPLASSRSGPYTPSQREYRPPAFVNASPSPSGSVTSLGGSSPRQFQQPQPQFLPPPPPPSQHQHVSPRHEQQQQQQQQPMRQFL